MPFAGLIGAGISAGGSILSGLIGGNAASKAAKQQRADALNSANQINATTASNEQFVSNAGANAAAAGAAGINDANAGIGANLAQILAGYSPYASAGGTSVGAIQQLAGPNSPLAQQFSFSPKDLQNDPGYAFTLKQGQDAIQRAAAAQGGLFSTGTMKSLAGYTEGTANQYFQQAFNNALNTFNTNRQGALSQAGILQSLAGQGLNAATGAGSALQTAGLAQGQNIMQGQQYIGNTGLNTAQFNANLGNEAATEVGGFLQNAGNAQAQGTLAQGRALQGGINGTTNALSNYLVFQNLLNGGGGIKNLNVGNNNPLGPNAAPVDDNYVV